MTQPPRAADTPPPAKKWPHFAEDAKYTIREIAELLKLKHADSVHRYLNNARRQRAAGRTGASLMPEPDGHEELSRLAYWYGRTINTWLAARRGSGWWGSTQDPRPRGRRRRSTAPDPDQEKS
jgi:hypothetical protein